MEELYQRNRIYLTEKEQELIKTYPILIAGCGIGSNIAECALRFGFENLTIIDGDYVEASNLNRQNYISDDILFYKSERLFKRLKEINPEADIKFHTEYINHQNVHSLIKDHKAAINALDFTSDIPLYFDQLCQEKNIPILHPYNLGWAGLVTVLTSDSENLNSVSTNFNELEMVKFIISDLKSKRKNYKWLEDILDTYISEEVKTSPPQLSVASWILGGICTHLLYLMATQKGIKKFPDYYINSVLL
ncbi:ThiF family adenylyltransferase [Chryseobacterium sp. SSA4.19]|uniref:ThiF family adenylyltransferase n=1 Tax=Chryseobacterium sp. SSA4.19 TaxID=2919915 RepID=UPI001F4EA59B|nr:ThiF family adenylyltransferase [Chryseobacterium sp. SSA4.19]MCJ8154923.1 ThiF family adenylyltransferase [Chryseobacterium sp. SSA4.19]